MNVISIKCLDCKIVFDRKRTNGEMLHHYDKDNSITDPVKNIKVACPECDSKKLEFK